MLDQISGGRLELGIGRGFIRNDYNTYGVPWEQGQPRLLEALEVIQKAWQHRPFSHHGQFFSFEDVSVWPPPLQEPHPPVWGSASFTPESFAWFGSRGYNLLTVIYIKPLDELAALLKLYRDAATASGFNRPICVSPLTCRCTAARMAPRPPHGRDRACPLRRAA